MDYTKNALDYTQILAQLKARGLLFKDEERAVEVLSNISYFRIANYLRYFEIDNDRHLYKPDTYFEDAVYIYYFDKKLRSLLFTAIQSIEVSLRSKDGGQPHILFLIATTNSLSTFSFALSVAL